MKTEKLQKKLVLDKKTIAALNGEDMKLSRAGGTGYPCATRTCVETKCFCD